MGASAASPVSKNRPGEEQKAQTNSYNRKLSVVGGEKPKGGTDEC